MKRTTHTDAQRRAGHPNLNEFVIEEQLVRRHPDSPLKSCEFKTLLAIRTFSAAEHDYARMLKLVQAWDHIRALEHADPKNWLPRKGRAMRIHTSSGGFNP